MKHNHTVWAVFWSKSFGNIYIGGNDDESIMKQVQEWKAALKLAGDTLGDPICGNIP